MDISFHLIGEESSIAVAVGGQLVTGKRLNRLCELLNEIAEIASEVIDDEGGGNAADSQA